MAKLPKSFTADGEGMGNFDCVPKGRYPFMIDKSEIVLTKAAKEANDPDLGQMMKLNAKIIAGDFKGKYVFIQLNIVNSNTQTVEIANKELTSICQACGKEAIDDTDELHGIPFFGTVKVVVDEDGKYPDKNEFTKYEVYDDTPSVADKKSGGSTSGGASKKKGNKKPLWK